MKVVHTCAYVVCVRVPVCVCLCMGVLVYVFTCSCVQIWVCLSVCSVHTCVEHVPALVEVRD